MVSNRFSYILTLLVVLESVTVFGFQFNTVKDQRGTDVSDEHQLEVDGKHNSLEGYSFDTHDKSLHPNGKFDSELLSPRDAALGLLSPPVSEDAPGNVPLRKRDTSKNSVLSSGIESVLSNLQTSIEDAGKQAIISSAVDALFSDLLQPDKLWKNAKIDEDTSKKAISSVVQSVLSSALHLGARGHTDTRSDKNERQQAISSAVQAVLSSGVHLPVKTQTHGKTEKDKFEKAHLSEAASVLSSAFNFLDKQKTDGLPGKNNSKETTVSALFSAFNLLDKLLEGQTEKDVPKQAVISSVQALLSSVLHLSKKSKADKHLDKERIITAAIESLSSAFHLPDNLLKDAQKRNSVSKQDFLSAVDDAISSTFHIPGKILEDLRIKAVNKIEENIKSGMKPDAAILDASLPMVKELLHTPSGVPGTSLVALDKALDQSQCTKDFERSLAALWSKKKWAGQMFDSWGKVPPGLLKVYSNFRGEYMECKEIRVPPVVTSWDHLEDLSLKLDFASLEDLAEEQQRQLENGGKPELLTVHEGQVKLPEFKGKFCHVGVTVGGLDIAGGQARISNPPVVVGVTMDWCVPSSCSESQITDLWNHTFTQLTYNKEFDLPLIPLPATCQEDLPRIEGKTIGILIFIAICMLGQGACTYYDVCYIQKPKWRLQRLKSNFIAKRDDLLKNAGTVQTNGQSEQRAPLLPRENRGAYPDGGEGLLADDMAFYEPELRTSQQAIQVFSLYTNGQRLLNTDLASHTLTCVHGIRALSMAWIVLGHSVLYSMPVAENTVDFYLRERKVIYSMVITNGTFSVDTFFILSGIMVGYTFLEIYNADSRLKWPVFVLYRFFRLSPSMVIVAALYICLWPAIGSGPQYPAQCPDEEVCSKYWYYSFFFINTMVGTGRKCMGWTWYLSVDYQLYLLSPFFMVPLVRGWKRTGAALAVVISLVFIVVAGVISHKYKMAETLIQTTTKDGGSVNVYDMLNRLYYMPYCRVAPYITGLMMGYYFKISDRNIKVPKLVVAVGWTLSTVVALLIVFGMYESYSHHHLVTVNGAAVYNSLKDTGFSLAVSWVIFACVTGNGGVVNTILSWKAFIMVSRVTYCMYLVHIPVLFYFAFSQEGTVWWTESYLVINWLGLLFVSTVVATIISLTTEAPGLRAQKLILTKLGFPVAG